MLQIRSRSSQALEEVEASSDVDVLKEGKLQMIVKFHQGEKQIQQGKEDQ